MDLEMEFSLCRCKEGDSRFCHEEAASLAKKLRECCERGIKVCNQHDAVKADLDAATKEVHELKAQVMRLSVALMAECQGLSCADQRDPDAPLCLGGYKKCYGCEKRAKDALSVTGKQSKVD